MRQFTPAEKRLVKRFVKLMREAAWNQSQTARELRVTSTHVNMIVNGNAVPSAALLHALEEKVALRRRKHPHLVAIEGMLERLRETDPKEWQRALAVAYNAVKAFTGENGGAK